METPHGRDPARKEVRVTPALFEEPSRYRLLPVLPLRDGALFPQASLETVVARMGTVKALEIAARCGRQVLVLAQKDPDTPLPSARDLHSLGTIATVVVNEPRPDGYSRVELDGRERARVLNLVGLDTLVAEVETVEEGDAGDEWGPAVEALARYIHAHSDLREFIDSRRRASEPMSWVNLACQHLPIAASARQRLLESDARERCLKISRGLDALLRKEQGT
jgi:ATP-dependent Lon protease